MFYKHFLLMAVCLLVFLPRPAGARWRGFYGAIAAALLCLSLLAATERRKKLSLHNSSGLYDDG